MSLRSPLGRIRGLGPAHDGATHWWMQRLTALALVPLVLWFVTSMAGLARANYDVVLAWVSRPLVSVLLLLLILAGFYHLKLGLQVVIEDYIHDRLLKMTAQVLVIFFSFATAIACLFAVLKLALGN